jgi:hypothetical protein
MRRHDAIWREIYAMNLYLPVNNVISYPESDPTFKEWLKLVEKEQVKHGILINVVLNRRLLYHYWANGYSPMDALKQVQEK